MGGGALIIAATLAFVASWSTSTPATDPGTAVGDSPISIFDDPIAFQAAWYPPYPAASEDDLPAQPVVVPTFSIFDDPIAFHAAWYPPYPAVSDDLPAQPVAVPTASIFDDPIAFHAAWYPPYP
jgi:hypothetical protein